MSDDTSRIPPVSNWSLRTKLIAVFAVPAFGALLLVGLRIADAVQHANVYDRALTRVSLNTTIAHSVDALQRERDEVSAWVVAGRPAKHPALDARIRNSDQAIATVRNSGQQLTDLSDPGTTEQYQQALTRLNTLKAVRQTSKADDFPASAQVISYNSMIESLLGVSSRFGADVTDIGLQNRQTALTLLANAKEDSAQQNTYLRDAAIRGSFTPEELTNINTARANLVSAIDNFTVAATPHNQQVYARVVAGADVSKRFQLQELSLQRAQANLPPGISANEVQKASADTLDKVQSVQNSLLADQYTYTDDLLTSARWTLILTSAVLLAAVLAAIALMVIVGRSLSRPLNRLRRSALDVADKHLPEAVSRIMSEQDPRLAADGAIQPVPVHTTEEVGQVARAFDAVHGEAVRLATEQALLRENINSIFVNLSRRSQRLVERQLNVIDGLEANEQDPELLSRLFELDHLATRLRRNGESLLVLSGEGLAKNTTQPVPAADLLGAAVSEIEQYARVEMGTIPDVAVHGYAVHDIAHLLAELLENATYFSGPDTKVSVRAVRSRNGGLGVQVSDNGVGMTADQIHDANKRLAEPPDLDVAVTRRMGLYVVSRLAQRHGIEVRIRENEDIEGGIVVRVALPPALLATLSNAQEPAREQPLNSPLPKRPAPENYEAHNGSESHNGNGSSGLVALAEPIRLEDLPETTAVVPAISDATEVFARPPDFDAPPPEPFEPQWADESQSFESQWADDEPNVPERTDPEPPQAQEEPVHQQNDEQNQDSQLPIFQSVLSHWFIELGDDNASNEQEDAPVQWAGAEDDGWQVAESVLTTEPETITSAGLPKRVPNAYLVPGSINDDASGGGRAQLDVKKAAAEARSKMAGFQRGHATGKHALRDSNTQPDSPTNSSEEQR